MYRIDSEVFERKQIIMKPLDWCPEPVAATGGINGQGVLRQLGRPAMDMAELLVREAIQNSWDARCPRSTSIEFRVHGRQLSPEQQSILNQFFFHGAFSNEAPSNPRHRVARGLSRGAF